MATSEDPFKRDAQELSDKGLDSRGRTNGLSAEDSGDLLDKSKVEITDDGGEYHKHGIFLHERAREMPPSEVVVHLIERAFGSGAML